MSNENLLQQADFPALFASGYPACIDVRAPVEFEQGHVPGAVNLPILNDLEREQVGTVYKQIGNEAATRLGHELVGGDVKSARVGAWCDFVKKNPNACLYCFRGGQRSTIAQSWLKDAGIDIPRVFGGYKAFRQQFLKSISQFTLDREMLVVCGFTGSGKTVLIEEVSGQYPVINLESLAKHRGSAFGSFTDAQPSQANFENLLACELIRLIGRDPKPGDHVTPSDAEVSSRLPLIEDESRMIGRCSLPANIFNTIRTGKCILVVEPIETRVDNVFNEYILRSAIGLQEQDHDQQAQALKVFLGFKNSLRAITKKLGGAKTSELLSLVEQSELDFKSGKNSHSNLAWIEILLRDYYDPLYLRALERRETKPIFQGTRHECRQFLTILSADSPHSP